MHVAWQDAVALTIVSLAALAIGRRVWRAVAPGKARGACGGCPSCSASSQAESKPLVPIESLLDKRS